MNIVKEDNNFVTREEFKQNVLEEIKDYPKDWRTGQAIFNYFDEEFGIARDIQYEDKVDCFYDDKYIDDFLDKAYDRCKKEIARDLMTKIEVDVPKTDPIICKSCMGWFNDKKCGARQMKGKVIGCTHYCKQPTNIIEWFKHYRYIWKVKYSWWKYKKKSQWLWWKWSHIDNGPIPSIVKAGDVIKWRHNPEYIKIETQVLDSISGADNVNIPVSLGGDIQKTKAERIKYLNDEHEYKIDKAWVMIERNKFEVMVSVNHTVHELNSLLKDKVLVSVGGKKAYTDPRMVAL